MKNHFIHHFNKNKSSSKQKIHQYGGMLIEGMASIVIITLAALALLGLQSYAIRVDNNTQYRHAATLVVADLANEMLLTKQEKKNTDIGTWSVHLDKLPNAKIAITDAPKDDQLIKSWVKDITITWMPSDKKINEPEILRTRLTIPKGDS